MPLQQIERRAPELAGAPEPDAAAGDARRDPPGPPALRDTALVAACATLFATLLAFRAVAGSELRYVLASREMLEGGDWVVPHLSGVPYMEKPILFYWLSAGAQWLLGASAAAAHAPSVLAFAILTTVAFALGAELRGRTFGLAAAGLFASCAGVLVLAPGVTTDPLFAATLAVTWYALWRHRVRPASAWKWVFWTALAAAMLTKGPLGPALVVASCAVMAAAERRVRWLLGLRPVLGGALFLALCAPWHVALWLRDPRLVDFFYIRQNVRAFEDGSINHEGPPWYYVPVLLALVFPWTALLFPAARDTFRALWDARVRPESRRVLLHVFVASCVVGPFLLLSAAGSKLGTYVLPLLPFVAVLLTRAAARLQRDGGRMLRFATALPFVVVVAGAAVGLPRLLERYDLARYTPSFLPLAVATSLALLACLGTGAVLGWRGRRGAFVALGAGMVACVTAVGFFGVDPGARFDAREAAHAVAALRGPDDAVVVSTHYAQDFSIPLTLGTRVIQLGRARELGMGHFVDHTPPGTPIPDDPYDVEAEMLPDDPYLVSPHGLRTSWEGPGTVWLFGREEDVVHLREHGDPIYTLFDDGKVIVYTNRPPESGGASTTPR